MQGKRIPEELARGNPEAVALALEIAVKYLKDNAGKGSFYNSFSAEPGDGVPPDEESLAKIGNHTATDLDFWFANQIAAGLEKAGLKDKRVGIYSYSDHAGVPSFDLHPQVGVMLTAGLDFSSGMTVEQRLAGFRERKAKLLGVYEYLNLITWSLDQPGSSPATDPLLAAGNLKRWYGNGANGYFAETSDSWISGGIGHYVDSRVLWNINSDAKQETEAYYQGAFGPAAKTVRALYEDWVKFASRTKGSLPKLTPGKLALWHGWIARAEQQVRGRPLYQPRLNDIKRYYLMLNLMREYQAAENSRLPSKAERFVRLMRYVGSNRGEGAFHAKGLFLTLLLNAPQAGLNPEQLGPEFKTLADNANDEAAWKTFAPIDDRQINKMFTAVQLPVSGAGLKVFPANAATQTEIKFPKLHGPPSVPRHYLVQVVAPTPKLSFEIMASNPLGGGTAERTVVVTDPREIEIKELEFKVGEAARFELADLKPGLYTVTFPEFGAEQLTVRGANIFGAVRPSDESWGFNPFRLSEKEGAKSYFLVPAGINSLKVRLSEGTVALGFEGGAPIAPEIKGAANKPAEEFRFAAFDNPRVAYVKWDANFLTSVGLVIEGVTLYSPDSSYVLYAP